MDTKLETVVKAIQSKFGATYEEFRDEVHIFVKPEQIAEALTSLRQQGFNLFSALTAVDYWPQTAPRFHVIYQLSQVKPPSKPESLTLQVRVSVNGDRLKVPTVTHLYETANWREREVTDMFGIEFAGHPDMRRILMPENWEGHPLRKDYPVEGYR